LRAFDHRAVMALLWLHGLGDTGAGWEDAFDSVAAKVPDVKFVHPTAPRQPVTCNGGAVGTSWFDIHDIPVSASEPTKPKGIDDTIAFIHGKLKDLEASGFSQGGFSSLQAGLRYPKSLGGIIAVSGWTDKSLEVHAANKTTPVLFSYGAADPIIDVGLSRTSAEQLKGALGEKVTVTEVRRGGHPPNGPEFAAVERFLVQCLSGNPGE